MLGVEISHAYALWRSINKLLGCKFSGALSDLSDFSDLS